jgi:hypothetical protein
MRLNPLEGSKTVSTTTLDRKLALLTDEEVSKCLTGLLHGLTIEKDDFARLLETPEEVKKVIRKAESQVSPATLENISPEEQSKAIRVLLVELGDTAEFRPGIEAWLEGGRDTMLIPLAVPLVLAGIVLVLSTDIKFEYKNEDGKKKVDFTIKKSPTSEKILGKFFGLFRGGS